MQRKTWVTREAFRQLVDAELSRRVGVGLDDLPDVALDDWLDDDDGLDAGAVPEAVATAVAEILQDNGFQENTNG